MPRHRLPVPSLALGVLALGSLAAVMAAGGLLTRPDCPEQAAIAAKGEPGFIGFGDENVPGCARHRLRNFADR